MWTRTLWGSGALCRASRQVQRHCYCTLLHHANATCTGEASWCPRRQRAARAAARPPPHRCDLLTMVASIPHRCMVGLRTEGGKRLGGEGPAGGGEPAGVWTKKSTKKATVNTAAFTTAFTTATFTTATFTTATFTAAFHSRTPGCRLWLSSGAALRKGLRGGGAIEEAKGVEQRLFEQQLLL